MGNKPIPLFSKTNPFLRNNLGSDPMCVEPSKASPSSSKNLSSVTNVVDLTKVLKNLKNLKPIKP